MPKKDVQAQDHAAGKAYFKRLQEKKRLAEAEAAARKTPAAAAAKKTSAVAAAPKKTSTSATKRKTPTRSKKSNPTKGDDDSSSAATAGKRPTKRQRDAAYGQKWSKEREEREKARELAMKKPAPKKPRSRRIQESKKPEESESENEDDSQAAVAPYKDVEDPPDADDDDDVITIESIDSLPREETVAGNAGDRYAAPAGIVAYQGMEPNRRQYPADPSPQGNRYPSGNTHAPPQEDRYPVAPSGNVAYAQGMEPNRPFAQEQLRREPMAPSGDVFRPVDQPVERNPHHVAPPVYQPPQRMDVRPPVVYHQDTRPNPPVVYHQDTRSNPPVRHQDNRSNPPVQHQDNRPNPPVRRQDNRPNPPVYHQPEPQDNRPNELRRRVKPNDGYMETVRVGYGGRVDHGSQGQYVQQNVQVDPPIEIIDEEDIPIRNDPVPVVQNEQGMVGGDPRRSTFVAWRNILVGVFLVLGVASAFVMTIAPSAPKLPCFEDNMFDAESSVVRSDIPPHCKNVAVRTPCPGTCANGRLVACGQYTQLNLQPDGSTTCRLSLKAATQDRVLQEWVTRATKKCMNRPVCTEPHFAKWHNKDCPLFHLDDLVLDVFGEDAAVNVHVLRASPCNKWVTQTLPSGDVAVGLVHVPSKGMIVVQVLYQMVMQLFFLIVFVASKLGIIWMQCYDTSPSFTVGATVVALVAAIATVAIRQYRYVQKKLNEELANSAQWVLNEIRVATTFMHADILLGRLQSLREEQQKEAFERDALDRVAGIVDGDPRILSHGQGDDLVWRWNGDHE